MKQIFPLLLVSMMTVGQACADDLRPAIPGSSEYKPKVIKGYLGDNPDVPGERQYLLDDGTIFKSTEKFKAKDLRSFGKKHPVMMKAYLRTNHGCRRMGPIIQVVGSAFQIATTFTASR